MKRRTLVLGLLFGVLLLIPGTTGPRPADAQETRTLRIATLAPRGSAWMRVFNAWNNTLRQQTDNRLQLQFFTGGSQGDERDVIRKIRIRQLDGAAVTSTGLSLVVRPVLVLQAPGVVENYRQLDRATAAMSDQFSSQFQENGVRLLGWGDVGENRIFSNQPITRPQDLRQVRPWVWSDDTIFGTFLEVAGVTSAVRLGVPEVLPALSSGQINAFAASATAASALQWHTRVSHVTQQASGVLIGATILSEQTFGELPPDLQQALLSTSERAHAALRSRIRRDDRRYYQVLTTRQGLTAVDISGAESDWTSVSRQARERLAGRVYPASLMRRVMAAARGN